MDTQSKRQVIPTGLKGHFLRNCARKMKGKSHILHKDCFAGCEDGSTALSYPADIPCPACNGKHHALFRYGDNPADGYCEDGYYCIGCNRRINECDCGNSKQKVFSLWEREAGHGISSR